LSLKNIKVYQPMSMYDVGIGVTNKLPFFLKTPEVLIKIY